MMSKAALHFSKLLRSCPDYKKKLSVMKQIYKQCYELEIQRSDYFCYFVWYSLNFETLILIRIGLQHI